MKMLGNNKLTAQEKKTLRKMFLRSHLVFLSFNMAKMEANGFSATMAPALDEIYGDDLEAKKEAALRHQNFFNTHAVAFNFIAGLCYAMEKEHHENNTVDGLTIDSIKAALMGPTAGMFDSLFFNCLRVIAAGVAIGLCAQGNFLGTIIFILGYGISQSILKYILLYLGYTLGTSFIDKVFNSGLMQALTKAASVLGLMMVGCMVATTVNVPLALSFEMEGASVVLLDIINSIFPGLLGVLLLFILIKLIKKGIRPTQLIIGILIVSLLGAFVGVF